MLNYLLELGKKISLFFFIQSYFAVPKNIRLNSSHLFHYKHFKQTRGSTNCI